MTLADRKTETVVCLVPTAGAAAAALHGVGGVWRATLPMRP